MVSPYPSSQQISSNELGLLSGGWWQKGIFGHSVPLFVSDSLSPLNFRTYLFSLAFALGSRDSEY